MKYQIENWQAFKVEGFKHQIKIERAFEIVPGLWGAAWKNGEMNQLLELFKQTDYRPAGFWGFANNGQWGNSEDMEYFISCYQPCKCP